MKSRTQAGALWRQGDVLFRRIPKLPQGERKRRASGIVAFGEVTGHTHALAEADQDVAEVWEIGGPDSLFVHISKSGISIQKGGATFVHQEHLPVTLPPGNYQVVLPRQYTPAKIVPVVD
jgi:hypothetical protein